MRATVEGREYWIEFAYEQWTVLPQEKGPGLVVHAHDGKVDTVLLSDSAVPGPVYDTLLKHDHREQPMRAVTCTILNGEKKIVTAGTAYCSPDDEFVKERGRKLALTRALASLPVFGRGQRREFWVAYQARNREVKKA